MPWWQWTLAGVGIWLGLAWFALWTWSAIGALSALRLASFMPKMVSRRR